MPALSTRTSTRPNSAIAASTSAWQSRGLETSAGTLIARRPGGLDELAGDVEPVRAAGAQDEVGAGLREALRERHAETGGRPGDDRDAPRK